MLAQVFAKARQEAPCYLVFEDLDSIVTDRIRSFFLNEVDGLSNNDGILMVGSTNHLDRLDPGISKRPSRFDRKYYFPIPDKEERIKYCEFWQGKLSENKEIDFPHRLCSAIAEITNGFSFAYMQEAFVAALLVIAGQKNQPATVGWSRGRESQMRQEASDDLLNQAACKRDDSDLDKLILWREIKLQIKILREGIEDEDPHIVTKASAAQKKTSISPSTPDFDTPTSGMDRHPFQLEKLSCSDVDSSSENHSTADYPIQLMLLEQNSKFRLATANLDQWNSTDSKRAQDLAKARADHASDPMSSYPSACTTGLQALHESSAQLTLLEDAQKRRRITREQDFVAQEEADEAFARAKAALRRIHRFYYPETFQNSNRSC